MHERYYGNLHILSKEFSEYDFQFHTKIIDYLENEQFSNVFAMFMYRMKRLAELSLAHKGRMEQTYEEHMAILDCMKNGDTSHIYEITLKHMETPAISTWKIYRYQKILNTLAFSF